MERGDRMTKEQVGKLLITIQAYYPNYNPPDKKIAINAWYVMLAEYPEDLVLQALRACIATNTSGFAPDVGQIMSKIQTISQPQELNEMEAWSLVSKALRNGYYGAIEEFNKLPPLVQKAVGSPDNLRNWAQTDSESIENVVQSNFMRTYRTVVNRAKEYQKMPKDIQALIESTNRSSYSAQIGAKNQQTIKLSLEDNKSQNKPIKGVPMPKEIKERIEQMKR